MAAGAGASFVAGNLDSFKISNLFILEVSLLFCFPWRYASREMLLWGQRQWASYKAVQSRGLSFQRPPFYGCPSALRGSGVLLTSSASQLTFTGSTPTAFLVV